MYVRYVPVLAPSQRYYWENVTVSYSVHPCFYEFCLSYKEANYQAGHSHAFQVLLLVLIGGVLFCGCRFICQLVWHQHLPESAEFHFFTVDVSAVCTVYSIDDNICVTVSRLECAFRNVAGCDVQYYSIMQEIIVNADIIMLVNIVPIMCLCVQYFEWFCTVDAGQMLLLPVVEILFLVLSRCCFCSLDL